MMFASLPFLPNTITHIFQFNFSLTPPSDMPAMAKPALDALPSELLIVLSSNIYDFYTLLSLSGTCKRLHVFYLEFGISRLHDIAKLSFPEEAFRFMELQRPGPRDRIFSLFQRDKFAESFKQAGIKGIEAVDRRLLDIPSWFGNAEARRMALNDKVCDKILQSKTIGSREMTAEEVWRARRGLYAGMMMFSHLYTSPNRMLTVLDLNFLQQIRIDTYFYLKSVLKEFREMRVATSHFIPWRFEDHVTFAPKRAEASYRTAMDDISKQFNHLCTNTSEPLYKDGAHALITQLCNVLESVDYTVKVGETVLRNTKVDMGVGPFILRQIAIAESILEKDTLPSCYNGSYPSP